MSQLTVRAATAPVLMGEGPHWDEIENVLYYVSVYENEIYRYDPQTKKQTFVKVDQQVTFIIPVKNQKNKFVISQGRNICLLTWNGQSENPESLEVLATVDDEEGKRENNLCDGKADISGRLWTGTLSFDDVTNWFVDRRSSFFSLSRDRKVTKHLSEITCSNGIAWTRDQKTMFYIDTITRKVEAFDFDLSAGRISNRRTVFDFETNGVLGYPDGMVIDTNEKLWVACFSGSPVIQVDPSTGKLLQSVPLPSPIITSVVFGGKNLDELYATSGKLRLTEEEREKYPTAGCVYHITGHGAKGLPLNRVVL